MVFIHCPSSVGSGANTSSMRGRRSAMMQWGSSEVHFASESAIIPMGKCVRIEGLEQKVDRGCGGEGMLAGRSRSSRPISPMASMCTTTSLLFDITTSP